MFCHNWTLDLHKNAQKHYQQWFLEINMDSILPESLFSVLFEWLRFKWALGIGGPIIFSWWKTMQVGFSYPIIVWQKLINICHLILIIVKVFYANSKSLVNKINQLELEIANYKYDLRRLTWTALFWRENSSLLFIRFSGVIVFKIVDVMVVFW